MRVIPVVTTFASLLLLGTSAMAEEVSATPSLLKNVYACAAIEDDAERLACFDTSVREIQSAEQAGQVVAVDSAQIQSLKREAFGFDLPSLPKLPKIPLPNLSKLGGLIPGGKSDGSKPPVLSTPEGSDSQVLAQRKDGEITKIGYKIARYKTRANGKYRFYLENGQVWEQVDVARVRIPRSSSQLMAEIRRASIGSYLMRINGEGRAIRVRRTR